MKEWIFLFQAVVCGKVGVINKGFYDTSTFAAIKQLRRWHRSRFRMLLTIQLTLISFDNSQHMNIVLIPGYTELFEEPSTVNYNHLVHNIPSSVIISVMIMINNELNAPIPDKQNQARLRDIICFRFSKEQLDLLNSSYNRFFQISNNRYQGDVFGRQYLLRMILKELNNYREVENYTESPQEEFNIFLAYLLVVDEVNDEIYTLAKEANNYKDSLHDYRLIWTPQISQFEFNEEKNIAFELFKLLCFCKYSMQKHRHHLAEYVNDRGFENLSQLINSIHQISISTLNYNSHEVITKLNYITPNINVDTRHIDKWSINQLIGNKKVNIDDLRKYPLFKTQHSKFLVIDESIYNKKQYKGIFFELYYGTTLKHNIKFDSYCSDIALNVMEKGLFKAILNNLSKHQDVMQFDDGSEQIPDCYIRTNKAITLLEFKAYLFPATLSDEPNFDSIKKYIDSRFIENDSGSPKGINQTINQIKKLHSKKYLFDSIFNNKLADKRCTIYPIIVHTEYHFIMPGINEYLNNIFIQNLPQTSSEIRPITLISLETLFDYAVRGGTIKSLHLLIDKYISIIKNRIKRYERQSGEDNFLRSKSSFDEIYQTIFWHDLKNKPINSNLLKDMGSIIGLTQEEIDQKL